MFTLHRGTTPLVVSVRHCGRDLPGWLREQLVPRALDVEDTYRHLERLHDAARELGATLITARHSRYLIDLNRPRDDAPMDPGANNTGLVPRTFFTGEPPYRAGAEPDAAEVQARVAHYWQPYHDALAAELARVKARYGHAVLFDGHSIRSQLPWLFTGRLPALNLGTAGGASCAPSLRERLTDVLQRHVAVFDHVVDGRFKGGHITRAYGSPHDGVHAVQMEMCWRCYLDEGRPQHWDGARAAPSQALLRDLLQSSIEWRPRSSEAAARVGSVRSPE
ncbi:N-formylglutamate deformylase [Azohydromonas sediminis]|uniref:N-formylglutamate deformylase n=1 Tax=Azohydromonas sediminis TaxID=2259674 RepID=UPI001F47723B|nr:N-formylglutamate deformylase [Azohydromonas sediminis]